MHTSGRVTPSAPHTFEEAMNVLHTIEVPMHIGKDINTVREEQERGLKNGRDAYYYSDNYFVWAWVTRNGDVRVGALPQAGKISSNQFGNHLSEILKDFRNRNPGKKITLRFPNNNINDYFRIACLKAGMTHKGIIRVGERGRQLAVFEY